jgi:hypothetical protein
MRCTGGVVAGAADEVRGLGQRFRRVPEPGEGFEFLTRGSSLEMTCGDPGPDDHFPGEGQQPVHRGGDLGQDLCDLAAALCVRGPLCEAGEIAHSGVAVTVRLGQRVQRGVEVDAVPGGEQGVRGGSGLQALLLDRHPVRKPVVVPAWSGGGEEAAGPLEDVRRLLDAADGDDQAGTRGPGDGDVLQHPEVGLRLLHRVLVAGVRVLAGTGGMGAGTEVGAVRAAGC